jgi:hypothetical protein
MATIQVDEGVQEQVALLARAWEISEGLAVARLLEHFRHDSDISQQSANGRGADQPIVPIYAYYNGLRIEATFNRGTRQVTILSGALAGQTFRSPSGAAVAVVNSVNPHIHPARNGWSFWMVESTSKTLQSLRYQAMR